MSETQQRRGGAHGERRGRDDRRGQQASKEENKYLEKVVAIKEYYGVSAESFALRLDELGLISPSLRLPLREQFRAYYRAHPEAMEPHPPAAPLSPISIAEAQ